MGKYQSKHDVKQTNFRTWKSGKIWIYAAGALLTLGAAGVFGTVPSSPVALSTRAFADTQQQAKANVTGAVSGTNLTITASSSQAGTNSGTTGDSISTINFTDTKSGDSITLSAKNNYSEEFGGAIIWKDNKTGKTGTATAAIDYKNNTVNLVTIGYDAPTGLSYKDQSDLEVQNFTYILGDKLDASKGFENATDASGNDVAFSSVKVDTSKVDLKTKGVYPVSYSIVDSATGKTLTKVANVTVENDPTDILMDNQCHIDLNSKFDAGSYFYGASDMNGNYFDLNQVTVDTSKLNTSKAGIYPVYYSIPDPLLSGGKLTMVLNVTVGSPLTGDASTFALTDFYNILITKGETDWATGGPGNLLGYYGYRSGAVPLDALHTSGTKIILKSPIDSSTATYDSAAVDANTLGIYDVPITVIDPIGNSQTMYATVAVVPVDGTSADRRDMTKEIDLPVGSSYSPTYGIDTGYADINGISPYENDLTYTTQSNVNMKVPGVYQTVYTITDPNLDTTLFSTGVWSVTSGTWNVTANVRVYDDTDTDDSSGLYASGVSINDNLELKNINIPLHSSWIPTDNVVSLLRKWTDGIDSGQNNYVASDMVPETKAPATDGTAFTSYYLYDAAYSEYLKITGAVNTNVAGKYKVTYEVPLSFSGHSGYTYGNPKTVEVNVAASTTPSAPKDQTALATKNITLNVGDKWNMFDNVVSGTSTEGANVPLKQVIVDDNIVGTLSDGNIPTGAFTWHHVSNNNSVDSFDGAIWDNVDTSKAGVYTVKYYKSGKDAAGNEEDIVIGTSTVTVVAPKDQSALSAPSHYDMTTGQTYDVSTAVKALNAAGQVVSPTYQVSAQDVKGQMIDTTGLLMGTSFAPKVAGTYTVTVTNGTKKASLKIAVAPSQVSPIVDEVTDNTAPSDPISSTDKVLIGTVTVKKVGDAFNAYDDYVTGAVSENNQPASSGAQTTMASAIQALLVKQYPDLATQIKSGYLNSTGVLTNLVGVHIISNNVNMNKAGTYVVNYLIDGATMTFTTGDPLPAQIIDLKNLIVTRTVIVEADTVSTPSQGKGQTPKSGSESTSTTLNSNGKNQVSMLATTQVKSAAQPMVKTAVASATLLPKTGDHSSVTLAETLLGLSFVGLSGLFLEMKRRRL